MHPRLPRTALAAMTLVGGLAVGAPADAAAADPVPPATAQASTAPAAASPADAAAAMTPAGTAQAATPAGTAGATTPAAAQAPEANCTVLVSDLDVDVNGRTATTKAHWDVTCRQPTNVTVELRVSAPHRFQRPTKGTSGTRFTGDLWTAGTVDPSEPRQTALLTIRENGTVVGEQIRKCAKRTDGTDSCYQAVGNDALMVMAGEAAASPAIAMSGLPDAG
ncbi:hypothetical protein ABT112_19855 [Streptomyces sp. NPDC002055]|uniref:hypothetical protein n=1 Tax=Streptomyces sp. NPDC002055 TaxID=3154534 RepID=UPI003329751E